MKSAFYLSLFPSLHSDFTFASLYFFLPDAISCPCSAIPPLNLTQPPPETCLEVDSRFRYNCAKGYVRKAGTSNLIKCQNTTGVVKWTEATLQCIRKISLIFFFAKFKPSPPLCLVPIRLPFRLFSHSVTASICRKLLRHAVKGPEQYKMIQIYTNLWTLVCTPRKTEVYILSGLQQTDKVSTSRSQHPVSNPRQKQLLESSHQAQ